MSKRGIAATFLSSGIIRRIWASTLANSGTLRILAYHRVIDDDPGSFPFDEGVISATTESFYHQMKFARSNFDVISFSDLYECELEGRPWPARPLIVTFDDGYRDNYTSAFPVLRELGLGATIFLTTGHIGRSELFWWDKIAYCVKRTERRSVSLPEIASGALPLGGKDQRAEAIKAILSWIKRVSEDVKQQFIERLSLELEVPLSESIAEGMHLSWGEVRQMAGHNIEFGSHTITHPILANISQAQLIEEIVGSKRKIEQELQREVLSVAYPVGRRAKFTRRVQEVVAQSGFRYAVSYDEGVTGRGAYDRYAMPRVHVEHDQSLSIFKANLMFPQWMVGRDHPYISQPEQTASQSTGSV